MIIIDLSVDEGIKEIKRPHIRLTLSGLMIIHGWKLNLLMEIQFYTVKFVEIAMGKQYLQEAYLY